jgi:signal transduction histidine kinase
MMRKANNHITMNTITANVSTLFPQLLISRSRQPWVASRLRDSAPPVPRPAVGRSYERRDLASLLRIVAWIFQPLATRKQVTLQVNAPVVGLVAVCDEIRIQRALEILLANAVHASPPNSTIILSARHEGNRLRFIIVDEGSGVPLDEQESIFDGVDNPLLRFISDDAGDDNELAVCRRIVNAHGGSITMRNRAEGGSRYEFSIPIVMPEYADAHVA